MTRIAVRAYSRIEVLTNRWCSAVLWYVCQSTFRYSLQVTSTANSILFLFNIQWTIRMKCYLQYSQWTTERSLCSNVLCSGSRVSELADRQSQTTLNIILQADLTERFCNWGSANSLMHAAWDIRTKSAFVYAVTAA